MNDRKIFICLTLTCASFFSILAASDFPPAPETYKFLNSDPSKQFVVSFGTSMSQTDTSDNNTASPFFIASQLQKLAQNSPNPREFLASKDRIWYLLRSLPIINCPNCQKNFDPESFDLKNDKKIISNIITDVASQKDEATLTVTKCPECSCIAIVEPKKIKRLTTQHQQAMVDQLNYLGLKGQAGCEQGLPPYRLSVEACDVMDEKTNNIDAAKLTKQADFLNKLGNPFLFCHHYSNPKTIPNLFEQEEHAAWFAEYCAKLAQASPEIKYICPISQPIAFSFRVTRQNLPPFTSSISQPQLFKNIIQAHTAAHDAIKAVSPKAQIFISHQWKPMVPLHGPTDLRFYLETIACTIANRMYNQAFVDELKKHEDKFDGLALSIYPPIYFDLFKPCGDNCSGVIDAKHSLESIMAMHKAFPGKKIVIVETGCNHPDTQIKKKFMDMTLHICQQARALGANVEGVYFWGHTNHPDFYKEWNAAPGATHFGMFDGLDPQDPNSSINDAGKYLKKIVETR